MQEWYKPFAVPATAGNVVYTGANDTGRSIKLLYGQIKLTTDATVANRRMVMGIYDASSNIIIDTHAGAVVTAGTADQHHEFMQGVYRETAFIAGTLQVPFGQDWVIPPGFSCFISVTAGVAGDSFSGNLLARIL